MKYTSPLVDSRKYLGAVLSYRNYEALSLKYRLQQSWIAFNRLTKALENRVLPVRLRLQLYNSLPHHGLLRPYQCWPRAEGRHKFRATIVRKVRMVIGTSPPPTHPGWAWDRSARCSSWFITCFLFCFNKYLAVQGRSLFSCSFSFHFAFNYLRVSGDVKRF